MSKLVWGENRVYETGLDRGVLYLEDKVVVWSGLVSLDMDLDDSPDSFFFDGTKYLEAPRNGLFTAKIKALMYPKEFEPYSGYDEIESNVQVSAQTKKPFGFTCRTLIQNQYANSYDYKIHIFYNLIAIPDFGAQITASEELEAVEFNWFLMGSPEKVDGFLNTAYAVVDSRYLEPNDLIYLENLLYGTDTRSPRLPSLNTLIQIIPDNLVILITDNGDGTWTADGPDELITMLDETTFQITEANAIYLDSNTFSISSSS